MALSRFIFNTLVVVLLLSVNGCDMQNTENRLLRDIQKYQEAVSRPEGPSWIATLADKYILCSLTNSHVSDLQSPRLVVPILGLRSNDAILAVFWIAEGPSIKGLELISEDGRREELAIPDVYVIENKKEANRGVVFRSVYRWQGDMLPAILKTNCSLRLMGADTNVMPLVIREIE